MPTRTSIKIKMADGSQDVKKTLICEYFNRAFKYNEILMLLDKYHGITLSIATLKRSLNVYNLKRRNPVYDVDFVRDKIKSLLDGPGCMGGYRHVWHTLRLQGIQVPHSVVQNLLKEIDPEG